MADIELVIKISEEMYTQIIDENGIDTMLIPYMDIIKKGTPLPKGHGRLIDENEVGKYVIIGNADLRKCPTIIEADRSEEV